MENLKSVLQEVNQMKLRLNNPNFPNGKKEYKTSQAAWKKGDELVSKLMAETGEPFIYLSGDLNVGYNKITGKYFPMWVNHAAKESRAEKAFKKNGFSTMNLQDVKSGETEAYKIVR